MKKQIKKLFRDLSNVSLAIRGLFLSVIFCSDSYSQNLDTVMNNMETKAEQAYNYYVKFGLKFGAVAYILYWIYQIWQKKSSFSEGWVIAALVVFASYSLEFVEWLLSLGG